MYIQSSIKWKFKPGVGYRGATGADATEVSILPCLAHPSYTPAVALQAQPSWPATPAGGTR